MGTLFETEIFSLAYDDETAFGTLIAVPSWNVLQCSLPDISPGREMQDLRRSVSQPWTSPPNMVGSAHGGTCKFTVDLRSQATTYDDPTDSLTVPPEWALIFELLGATHTGTSAAGDVVAGWTAVTGDVTATDVDEGACIYTGTNAATAVTGLGWVTDTSGAGPYTLTLHQDSRSIPAVGNDLYGMKTGYGADTQPVTKNLYFKGQSTEHGLFLLGWKVTAATLRLENGKVFEADIEGVYNGHTYDDAAGAGVESVIAAQQLPPPMLGNGGRITIDGNSTGAADATGTCDLGLVTIELSTEPQGRKCWGGPEGYSGINIKRNPARISFSVPWTGDGITAGVSKWNDSLINNTTFSLMAQTGLTVGQVCSVFAPALVVKEEPTLSEEDGKMMWGIVAEPRDDYTADTGTTVPADTPFRIAIG